jgi:Ni/Co efflux regulator RcnB
MDLGNHGGRGRGKEERRSKRKSRTFEHDLHGVDDAGETVPAAGEQGHEHVLTTVACVAVRWASGAHVVVTWRLGEVTPAWQ